jgi:DNA-damage-inducible protein J
MSGKVVAETSAGKKRPVKARKAGAKKSATAMVHARIDSSLKTEAEKILAELGLNASDAIRMLYCQVALRKGLPFEVHIPNAETEEAIRDIEAGRDVVRYGSTAELLEDLGI